MRFIFGRRAATATRAAVGIPAAAACVLLLTPSLQAARIRVNVVGSDGQPVNGFRYTVEEDRFYRPMANTADPNQLSLSFHRSHMPVVTKGDSAGLNTVTIQLPEIDPAKQYFVSILPNNTDPNSAGYSNSGVAVPPGANLRTVTITVNQLPIPTAQISVFVFADDAPLNGQPDLPEELGLAGFTVKLEDAGGSYGASAGEMTVDVFGNLLGTTYQTDPNTGQVVLDASGAPIPAGWAPLKTDAEGRLLIKYLAPAKYGVLVIPPSGQGWQQTTTIEGTKINDAWVKAGEPPFFQEFGPPGPHVFFGFTRPANDATLLTGGATLTGSISNLHMSAPPATPFYRSAPVLHTVPWVALNSNAGVAGSRVAFSGPAAADGTFSIPNVPPGDWQLTVFDSNLDFIIASYTVSVHPDNTCNNLTGCDLGDIPVFQWFTRQEHWVFYDDNANGMFEPELGEFGIPDQLINIRFRDGSINQTSATDVNGFLPFDEVFPFFAWEVAEVDYGRYKPTGVTVVVDAGGPVPLPAATPPDWTLAGQVNPQLQPENANQPYRVETGPVLLEGFQGFIGQTTGFAWGKKAYEPGENGGITGVAYYGTTRAENDPRFAAAEPFEPGVAGITFNLYRFRTPPADPDNPTQAELADTNLLRVATAVSDSWDDAQPDGCVWDANAGFTYAGQTFPTYRSCFDGLRPFNQARPAVFDGGYAFSTCRVNPTGKCAGINSTFAPAPLPPDLYVVEMVEPRDSAGNKAMEVQKESSKNVDFGAAITPSIPFAACVNWNDYDGDGQPGVTVPAELELFPGVASVFAGQQRPVCNRKLLRLSDQQNATTDFFLYTQAPIAAHAIGFILDDLTNEFDPNSPQFGEKYAPPWMPISFHDFTGREITRVLSDQFGLFNALVPSTYSANVPMPSGYSPNMLISCMNSKVRPDGTIDPNFDKKYSQFCYTLQYMPGKTTYLDTPVVPVAAFAGGDQFPVDCELATGTPRIASAVAVNNTNGTGPYLPASGGNRNIRIRSVGTVQVPNPAYCPGPPLTTDGACPVPNNQATIARDYGFGNITGTVTLGGLPLAIVNWNDAQITATVPANTPTGELVVTRAAATGGRASLNGVTVQVGLPAGLTVRPVPSTAYRTIQSAIDAANDGDLVLVAPGTYNEAVIMWKPVKLQGSGEATIIDAVRKNVSLLQNWRTKAEGLVANNRISLLPSQAAATPGGLEPTLFASEEGAGIFVAGLATGPGRFQNIDGPRIDGFSITGADNGGGVMVNGYARFLDITNNRIVNNTGDFGGGVRVGHPLLASDTEYISGQNNNIAIRHNQISSNGAAEGGSGGGISLCTGSDNYRVFENFICGNFSQGDGAGIGHLGRSDGGIIRRNTITFNENFNQSLVVHGGGISIAGQVPLAGQTLSPGSGSVEIFRNLIQGNSATVGDGGGIRTALVNGQELVSPAAAHRIDIVDNIIVNNEAALAGGGIALQDTAFATVLFNTVARNDSTATSSLAFSPGVADQSNPQPAGIVSRAHSAALLPALATRGNLSRFSDPDLRNNIVWQNRSFYFTADPLADPPAFVLQPAAQLYNDLGVLGTGVPTDQLNPAFCVLTSIAGYLGAGNTPGDPLLQSPFFNAARGAGLNIGEPTTALPISVAADEGGNFVRVRFGPLFLTGNYHIGNAGSALNAADPVTTGYPAADFDGQVRVFGGRADIGADEYRP